MADEAPVATTEAPETPTGRVSVGDSVRAAIAKADAEPKLPPKPAPKPEGDRPRDPEGKFAPKAPSPEATTTPAATPKPSEGVDPTPAPATPPKPSIRAPQSLTSERKADWDKLSPEWQGEIDRLERAAKTQFDRNAAAVQFAQQVQGVFQPYEATIRALGATPIQALQSFLDTDHRMRSGTPAMKTQTLLQLAQHYGIDLSGIAQGQVPQVDPNVAVLQQRLDAMERARQQEAAQRTNAESAQVTGAIQAFAADPKNEHFEEVRLHMGALMESGAASTLEDAYQQACWANPTIRQKLIQSQQVEAEAKRKADEREAVERKRAAGVQVHGTPASPIAAPPGKKETVGETVRRVSAQVQGRI